MTATLTDILTLIAPEVAALPNVDVAIEVAELFVPADIPVDKRPTCVAYYVAHMMTLNAAKGAAGGVSSMTEGGLNISYGGSGGGQALSTTSYGQTYTLMVAALVGGPLLVE